MTGRPLLALTPLDDDVRVVQLTEGKLMLITGDLVAPDQVIMLSPQAQDVLRAFLNDRAGT